MGLGELRTCGFIVLVQKGGFEDVVLSMKRGTSVFGFRVYGLGLRALVMKTPVQDPRLL